MTTPPKHPAKFSRKIINAIAAALEAGGVADGDVVLDNFAGTGRIHQLRDFGFSTVGIEIEPEWANMHPDTIVGNALCLPFADGVFGAVATSCTYANRMADAHEAKDKSERNTYRHKLGRKLHEDNSGAMQWGPKYRDFHTRAWTEAIRVIRPGGAFVLNCKNHIRAGSVIRVTEWHIEELCRLGLQLVKEQQIEHRGNRQGQNGDLRVPYESVVLLRKP